jgi:plastocyanin
VSHVSAATDLLGLEDDYTQIDDSTEVYWKLLQEGVQYRGEYNTSTQDSTQTRYKLNDLVKYGPSIYECIRGHAPSIPEVVDFGVYTSTAISPFGGAIVYTVTVATGTNQYGAGNKYYFAGEIGASPALSLTRGLTYRFDQSDPSNATHQLLFSATPNGSWNGGGVEYTTGVTKVGTAGTEGAYTQITVPDDAPALYYYCINHSGMGGTAIPPGLSSFTVSPAANAVDEGSTLTINVTTTNVTDNTQLYWTVTNAADFSVSSGSFTVTGNSGTFTVNPDADVLTEGVQTFVVQIRTGSISGTIVGTSNAITINDTSQAPPASYTSSSSANDVDEGSPLTITVTTSNVADATTLYWTATNAADFDVSSGSFTINSNTGSFTVTPTADTSTEGAETFDVEIRIGSTVGTVVDTLTSITINDTSQGVAVSADYTFTVTNVGASAYTIVGTDQNGAVNGDNVGLTFSQGDIVDFAVNASGHPFYIKTAQTTGIGDQAGGVTNNGTDGGTVRWTVGNPGTYYYICEFHGSMYGEITV